MKSVLSGIIPACHTPFLPDGQLNLDAVKHQYELFRECGIRSVFVCGTTGEWASLSVSERKALCERWLEIAGSEFTIGAHVGCHCQRDAIELAAHAARSGAHAVAVMAPSFYKPATVKDVVDFLVPIAAAADPLPFYYYHFPGITGIPHHAADVVHEARFRIPTLRGLKFSSDSLLELQRAITIDDGAFDVLLGCDEGILPGYLFGIQGAIGATFNFAGAHFETMRKAIADGDFTRARTLQLQASRAVKVLADTGFLAASKAAMRLVGVDVGPMRAPIATLPDERLPALAHALEPLGVLARPIRIPAR